MDVGQTTPLEAVPAAGLLPTDVGEPLPCLVHTSAMSVAMSSRATSADTGCSFPILRVLAARLCSWIARACAYRSHVSRAALNHGFTISEARTTSALTVCLCQAHQGQPKLRRADPWVRLPQQQPRPADVKYGALAAKLGAHGTTTQVRTAGSLQGRGRVVTRTPCHVACMSLSARMASFALLQEALPAAVLPASPRTRACTLTNGSNDLFGRPRPTTRDPRPTTARRVGPRGSLRPVQLRPRPTSTFEALPGPLLFVPAAQIPGALGPYIFAHAPPQHSKPFHALSFACWLPSCSFHRPRRPLPSPFSATHTSLPHPQVRPHGVRAPEA